jgi:23S rRNA (guanosine2251-2'-O)-methyltransferase
MKNIYNEVNMLIYSKNVVLEALKAHRKIHKIMIEFRFSDKTIMQYIEQSNITLEKVDKGHLNNISNHAVHQGIVAEVEPYSYTKLDDVIHIENGKFLILDSIEDPHNLGAIIRTSDAMGITAIIMSQKQQVPLTSTVAKVSTGAIEYVPIVIVPQLFKGITQMKAAGIKILGTDMVNAKHYESVSYEGRVGLILGNEGRGIRTSIKPLVDDMIMIPMKGHVQSLNVSVAAALLMNALTK